MKRFVIPLVLMLSAGPVLTAQDEDKTPLIPEGQTGIIPDEPRELILFDSKRFIFGSYMQAGLHENTSANMIEGNG